MKPEEIFGKDYLEFASDDPFNNNFVEGYICRRSGDLYGALLINKVNGNEVPQLIYCTPKIDYPFDRNGQWVFPKAKRIERYEKLDGTNIFAYRYSDASGSQYLSYKTRLLPFVRNSRFGPFLTMLSEVLAVTSLAKLPWRLDMNISFELWGARNPHLIIYDVPLALSVLFARKGNKVLPPSMFLGSGLARFSAELRGTVEKDYVTSYQQAQVGLEGTLKQVEDKYSGKEGEVWYLMVESGDWVMFKCKPETIEAIHWASGGIGKNIIRATCENAFENWDCPTVENVVSLLLEEFEQDKVDKVYYSIEKHLNEAVAAHEFRDYVMSRYQELGVNILEDKRACMSALSQHFKKDDMKKVYSIIWAHVSR